MMAKNLGYHLLSNSSLCVWKSDQTLLLVYDISCMLYMIASIFVNILNVFAHQKFMGLFSIFMEDYFNAWVGFLFSFPNQKDRKTSLTIFISNRNTLLGFTS